MRALFVFIVLIATWTSLFSQDIVSATIVDERIVSVKTRGDGEFMMNIPVISFKVRNRIGMQSSSMLKIESNIDTAKSIAYQILVRFSNPTPGPRARGTQASK